MITLDDLTGWEERLVRQLDGRGGPLDERDGWWARTGLYADYAAIFSGYVDLVEAGRTPEEQLEALKRAVFLVWYEGAAPAPLSGLTELPDSRVRQALSLLEQRCIHHGLDPELGWMLAWYWSVADQALLRVAGLACLEEQLRQEPPDWDRWRRTPMPADAFARRGRMGQYWESVRRTG
jgi:hypothetical protein